jgi:hypothetical protein
MRLLFRFIDRLLRKCTGVFEFADNPECLFRLQFGTAPHDIELENEVVRAGEPVLFLHLWNDHIVPVSTQATPVTWAIKAARWLRRSFQQIAQFVLEEPRARDVRAVGGSPGFLSSVDRPAGVLFMRRLGFEIFPYHSPLGRFGLFLGESLLLDPDLDLPSAQYARPPRLQHRALRALDEHRKAARALWPQV